MQSVHSIHMTQDFKQKKCNKVGGSYKPTLTYAISGLRRMLINQLYE